jgi:putative molybdopterin biosynthesis protein
VRQRDYFHEPLQTVIRFMASKEFAARAEELGGYNISAAGSVRFAI